MTHKTWRLFFTILLSAIFGGVGWSAARSFVHSPFYKQNYYEATRLAPLQMVVFTVVGMIFGFWLGAIVFRRIELFGQRLDQMSTRDKLALGIGTAVGLLLTVALSIPILIALRDRIFFGVIITLLIGVAICYLCIVAALSMKEEIRFYMPPAQEAEDAPPKEKFKILDTNVIIDGRIADIARTGFLDGPIYIPGFVLDELQHIADSADGLKRARGRRGLDILNGMQKELKLLVRSYDRMAPGAEEVDSRLVRLAKALGGIIVTNDFNLNKVAELQGVQVLNVNELANALKPVVLPGEEMTVTIVKEGKEMSQGVGYLDDGTMIVVEGGRRYVGDTVDVLVSSVLQTQAGKMIFAHLHGEGEDENGDGGVRSYSGRRPRRPVR